MPGIFEKEYQEPPSPPRHHDRLRIHGHHSHPANIPV
jgi:hypothetical protein